MVDIMGKKRKEKKAEEKSKMRGMQKLLMCRMENKTEQEGIEKKKKYGNGKRKNRE